MEWVGAGTRAHRWAVGSQCDVTWAVPDRIGAELMIMNECCCNRDYMSIGRCDGENSV